MVAGEREQAPHALPARELGLFGKYGCLAQHDVVVGGHDGEVEEDIAFLNEYWLHFEVISVLLIAAVVAAIAVIKLGLKKHG